MGGTNSDTRYLRKIGSRWYARVRVPRKLVASVGRPEIQKALGTGDLREAQKRRWAVVQEAHRLFAAHSGDDDYLKFVSVLGDGPAYATTSDGERIYVGDDILWREYPEEFDELERRSYEGESVQQLPIYQALSDNAAGLLPVSVTLERFLAANSHRLKDKAVENYRAAVKRWTAFTGERPIERTPRAKAVEFADGLDGLALATKARTVRNLARLFEYATRGAEVRPQNPFRDLVEISQAATGSYEPLPDEDIVRLYESASIDAQRALLYALYSGMRRSEITRAQRAYESNIQCFKLTEGKTRNAVRLIPLHRQLVEVELPSKSENAITVELRRLQRRLCIDGRGALHRARKSFATKLERAGVSEGVAARLLEHRMAKLSYGLYSGGQDLAVLTEAVQKVRYPDLESFIRKHG